VLPDEVKPLQNEAQAGPSIEKASAEETVKSPQSKRPSVPARPRLDTSQTRNEGRERTVARERTPHQSDDHAAPEVGGHSRGAPQPVISQPQTDGQRPIVQLLQLPSGKVAVEVHAPPHAKGFWRACGRFFGALGKDYGSLLTGLLTVTVTIVIAYFAQQINEKQAAITQQQAKSAELQSNASQEQVRLNFIKEFRERLGELTDKDQRNRTKKNVAAIALAQYREEALVPLKMSLTVEDEDVRDGAAVVVVQMLSDKNQRANVLAKLEEYFDENNASLRVGVLDCYLTMNRDLTDDEFTQVKNKIRQHLDPSADYSAKRPEQRVLLWAAKFFGNWPTRDSKDFLLAVARNRTSGDDPRQQAIDYLPNVTMCAKDLSVDEREVSRQEILAALQLLLPELPGLSSNVKAAIAKLKRPCQDQ
jgi:hypothetical protein